MASKWRRFEVLLPLQFNDGREVPPEWLAEAVLEVVDHFGAASYETQKVEGHWRQSGVHYRDELVKIVVDVPDTAGNRRWMREFKARWKTKLDHSSYGWLAIGLNSISFPSNIPADEPRSLPARFDPRWRIDAERRTRVVPRSAWDRARTMKSSLSKKKAILARIKNLEEAIAKGQEYLQTGAHANWQGFRPLFTAKKKNGKALPPHPDWVRNWFLPSRERALKRAKKLLERLT